MYSQRLASKKVLSMRENPLDRKQKKNTINLLPLFLQRDLIFLELCNCSSN